MQVDLLRWDGTVRPNVLNAATRFWLEQNLRPLVGHVDAVALYDLFGSSSQSSSSSSGNASSFATLAECTAISSHILKEFKIRVVWMDPELQVDSLDNVPSWIFSSAPVLMRYGHGSRLEQVILAANSQVSGAEIHMLLGSEDTTSSSANIILGRFGSDHAAVSPMRFGTSLESRPGALVISKLACDARTLSGTLSSKNGYLSSQAKGSKTLQPCIRVSCSLGFRPTADVARAYVPSWWLTSTSAAGCVDQSASSMVVLNWTRDGSQADLQVPSPYGTVGPEKAADLAFDLALTLGALSHGAASSMRSNGLSIAFEHFGTPLSENYCDTVTEYELTCYPFLCNHPDDAIASFADSDSEAVVFSSNPYSTPFVSAGVRQTSEWSYVFQRRWSLRSNMRLALTGSDPFVPWISTIAFEPSYYSSSRHAVHEPYKGIEGACHAGSAIGGYWPGVESDPRFSREVFLGLPFPSLKESFGSSATRCDIVGKDGSPQGVYSPSDVDYQNDAKNYAQNRAFSLWFDGVSRQIVLGAIASSAWDVLGRRFTECKFIAPGLSVPQNASIPDLRSAFVADSQGAAYSPAMIGCYAPLFNYINIAQFGNASLATPSALPYGGFTSYEVRGESTLRDGSNRTDWIIASDGRGVVLGNPTMSITNAQYAAARSSMSSLHAKAIIRYMQRSSEVDFTAICMPMLGLQPKGGLGDIRTGESLPSSSGYADTMYAISQVDFKSILSSRNSIVIYDIDSQRSKAEWDNITATLAYPSASPVLTTGSVELPPTRQASVGFVGYPSVPAATGISMKVSSSGGVLIFVDAQGREVSRKSIVAKTFGALADEVASFGVDVKVDPQYRGKPISTGEAVNISVSKNSSRALSIADSMSLPAGAAARIGMFLTSPDPLQASRMSRGGFPSIPMAQEIGKLAQGIGAKDMSAATDAQPFSTRHIMIGNELVEASCAAGVLSITRRYGGSVHRQGETLQSISADMFNATSLDGRDIARCVALVNCSSDMSSGRGVLNISGMPDGSYCVVENPNRQGFLFNASSVVGNTIVGVNKSHSMRKGDAVAIWPPQSSGRYLVSSMSGDRLELTSRPASTSRSFWCMPTASRLTSASVGSVDQKVNRKVAAGGSISAAIGGLAPGEAVYCWISAPKSALRSGAVGFTIKIS